MTRLIAPKARRRWEIAALVGIAGLQVLCATVFVEDLAATVFGLRTRPISWTWRETIEILAAFGLILGMILSGLVVRMAIRQRQRAQQMVRAAAGEFHDLIHEQFQDWKLTPSEREVALFMLKGFANQEIAELRQTSEGTIKAQCTAVFRKADVTGRPQLLSYFIEELLADESAGPEGRGGA